MAEFDKPAFRREVGLLIGLARRRDRRTQQWLADKVGVKRTTIANTETGRQGIAVDLLFRVAVVLRVGVSNLIPTPTTGEGETPE